jgi:hypothetical protein
MLSGDNNDSEPILEWSNDMIKRVPPLPTGTQYQMLILIFVRAHRENNFSLYVDVLKILTPLFFALDHVNYSSWVSFHICDMKT